ncbi:centrosomal protein of 78 kDa-like [Schistocerca serialis cubense]|uniref:centrosomal protein of 78 kDa-like n=1 Tax=Schistocerca serialis cubense TaxID=2023355 RepID=UPI00214F3043|nr:centrosomal protein of 78 kDa-like [Schistocerca serialis cubense]
MILKDVEYVKTKLRFVYIFNDGATTKTKMVGPAPDKKISTSNFFSVYDELCRKRKMMPLRNVKEHAWRKSIDFYTDRIKCDEWIPIIEAIATDRSLHYVAIRSRYEKKGGKLKLGGGILLKDEIDFAFLMLGISKCCSLQNISFHRCCLGDAGCEMICNTIKNSPNIRTIGMSGCNISEKGAYHLYLLLKHQQMERYNESWVQSLRYRAIDGAMLGGVRRITLNDNKELGDAGIAHFIEILKDDFWLKAIDLQNCGITDHGGFSILQMLEINNVLLVVDIRNNRYISSYIENEIMKTLARNNMQNLDESKEYCWISLAKSIENSASSQRLKSSPSGSSIGSKSSKKNEISSQRGAVKCSVPAIKRSCSDYNQQKMDKEQYEMKSHKLGLVSKQQQTTEDILQQIAALDIARRVGNPRKDLHSLLKRFQMEKDAFAVELQKMKPRPVGGYTYVDAGTTHPLGNSFKASRSALRVGDGVHKQV